MTHTRFHSRIRMAMGALCAMTMVLATAACSFNPQPEHPTASTSKTPTGSITLVASLNQWGSLAAAIGGDDVKVTSILSSTTVDAHDFEPTAQDVKALHNADVVLVNGAGYDTWASKNMASSTTCISVSDIVGAMDGDNPHLWFSRDARFAIASELADTFSRLRPGEKKTFSKNLKAWQTCEDTLERHIHEFSKAHPDTTYAATEDVAYYLMSDMGFEDRTPQGYTQAMMNDAEPTAADMRDFKALLADDGVDLFINGAQTATELTDGLVKGARNAKIPVQTVTEQMPSNYKTLTDWIEVLFTQITEKVDPSFVPSAEDDESASSESPSPQASTDPSSPADAD